MLSHGSFNCVKVILTFQFADGTVFPCDAVCFSFVCKIKIGVLMQFQNFALLRAIGLPTEKTGLAKSAVPRVLRSDIDNSSTALQSQSTMVTRLVWGA